MKIYDFNAKSALYKTLTITQLRYALFDAIAARDAAASYQNDNDENYYSDDASTIEQVMRGQ